MNDDPLPPSLEEHPSYELEIEPTRGQKVLAWFKTWPGILALVGVVLLAFAGVNAKRIYNAAKVWRATKLIEQCEQAALTGDEAAELRYLRQAFALQPATALTLRALARFHERRGEPGALPIYEQLLSLGRATPDDSLRACRLAALQGQPALGRKILESVQRDPALAQLPAVAALRARLMAADGSWTSALALARKAAEHSSEDGAEKMVLARLLLQAAEQGPGERRPLAAQQAVELLASLAPRYDQTGVEALTALISLARQPAAARLLAGQDVATWIEAAQRHPKATPRLRVLAWNLQLATKTEEPEKFYAAFLEQSRTAALEQRLEAARWLNQHGKARESLELSTPQKESSADWFLVFLDALAATGQWTVVLEQLEARSGQAAAMPGALRALFQFRARSELRQPLDATETWRDIQVQLQSEPVRNQLYVAQYAERTGDLKQAALIYRRLLDQAASPVALDRTLPPEAKFACYSGLIRSVPPNAPVADVLPLFEGLCAEFPELEEARNDATYLRLLTGVAEEKSRLELAALLAKNPALLAYRSTAALLELRLGAVTAADRLYDGWKIDWSTAPDRFRAVRVAVLTARGRHDEAETLRATINERTLRPEEIALLKSAN